MMTQRSFPRALALCLAGGLSALAISCGGSAPEEEAQATMPAGPHPIIVLDLNAVRADHLGCYGHAADTTPSIDALATESVLFEWAFTAAPDPAPAQASLLTGLYPDTHQFFDQTTRLPEEAVTLAEALGEGGYKTAAFVDGGFLNEAFGLAQGFDEFHDAAGGGLAYIGPRAMSWLEQNARENFLLVIHTSDAHAPYEPPAQFMDGTGEPPAGFASTPEALEALAGEEPSPEREAKLAHAKALYDAELRYVDDWIGTLAAKLRELGLDRRATVVIVADHGQEFLEHGGMLHGSVHTPVSRVPLIVRLPGGQQAGRIPDIVDSVDLAPTLMELAGVAAPASVQGESLVPMILGDGQPPYLAYTASREGNGAWGVAMAGYRMVVREGAGSPALYDLASDPLEQTDVAGENARQLEVLGTRLAEWKDMVGKASFDPEKQQEVDEDTLEQLKGLGYIQ